MGLFPGMVTAASKGGTKSYLVSINDIGECVITSYDPGGNPAAFVVSSDPLHMLISLARKLYPNVEIHTLQEGPKLLMNLFPRCGVLAWREVAAELNRKPKRVAARLIEYRLRLLHWDHPLDKCLDYSDGTWSVTDSGKAFDDKFFPEPATDGQTA